MKKTILFSTAVAIIMFAGCNNSTPKSDTGKSETTSQTFALDTTKLKSGDKFYQCEMHPEVISDKPGNCPKCGMELSEIKKS